MIKEKIENYQYEIEKERNKQYANWLYISYCCDQIRDLYKILNNEN